MIPHSAFRHFAFLLHARGDGLARGDLREDWSGEHCTGPTSGLDRRVLNPVLKECNLHIVELDYSGRRAPAGFPKVYRHCIHPVRGGVARHGISSGQESVIVDRGSDQHTAFAEYVGGVLPTLR